jgi:hypothetical protein
LHPTGARLTYFSGRRQQQDQASLAGIPIELTAQRFNALNLCEWFPGSRGLILWFNLENQQDTDAKRCKHQQIAF